MHHYPFHVGDYIMATAHLDLIEDCVYRRLIDLYMETEQPIPNETQQVSRRLRLGSSGLILDSILSEFFTLEADNCWHNARCDAEIREFLRLAEISRINGKLGGRPKKTHQVIFDNPDITQQQPVGLQPIPNTQYPIPIKSTAIGKSAKKPPSCPVDEVVNLYHQTLPELPKLIVLTAKRESAIKARWMQFEPDTVADGLRDFENYFSLVRSSGFLMGKIDPINGHKRFYADLEWLVNSSNFAKVIERKYHEVR